MPPSAVPVATVAAGAEAQALHGLSLLIADDHEINRTIARRLLERAGATVHCVEDGAQALAFVERGEAAAGVVYETDARLSPRVRVAGVFPADSHAPIGYPVAAVAAHDTPAARAFLRLLESEAAHEVFRRHGFTVR